MTEGSEGASEKPCRTCAKPMPAAALKCTECDSYQDWRRLFSFTTSLLSLLVALIAVSTAAAPVIKETLQPARSKLSFQFLDSEPPSRVLAFATNGGTRSAVIRRAYLSCNATRNGMRVGFASYQPDNQHSVVEPGKSQVAILQLSSDVQPIATQAKGLSTRDYTCSLTFSGSEFDGTKVESRPINIGSAAANMITGGE